MDQIKNQLSYNESNSKFQAVSKLFKLLDTKFGANIFLENNERSVEISLMYECISSEDSLISSSALKLLLKRVFDRPINIFFILNKLEIFTYSTMNSKYIIEAIIEILIFNKLTSQYSTNDHCKKILVKIIQSKPDNLIHIQNYYITCKFKKKNINMLLEILNLLMNYIYLGIDSNYKGSLQLTTTYCILSNVTMNFDNLKYLCKIMRWFNLNSFISNSLVDVLHLIASTILREKDFSTIIDIDDVVLIILELIIKMKLDFSILLQDVIHLLEFYPDKIMSLNGMMITTCSLLYEFPTLDNCVLQLVECLLKINDERLVLNSIVCSFLILPLLQKFIIPSSLISLETVAQLNRIFETLESLIQQSPTFKDDFYEINNCRNSFKNEMLNLISFLIVSDDNMLCWLTNIVSTNCDLSDITYEICCLICAILIATQSFELIKLCLEMLQKICNMQKAWSCQILQLIIYKLKSEKNSLICNLLLTYLPKLMTSKINLNKVQSLLQQMFENEKMVGKAIQLAWLLWCTHPSTIPFLISLFSRQSSFLLLSSQLARMDAIKKICELAPENHGEELLHYISAVFSDNKSDPALVCLALQSLYFLCKSEIINLLTTWKIIGTKLLAIKNSIVLSELCNFMSLAGQFNFEDIDYQLFKSRILNELWSLIKHNDGQVSSSAFKALKHFTQEDIECISFEWLKNDQTDIYTSNEIVQLLVNSKLTQISGHESFISQLVKYELERLPRAITFASNRCEVETVSNIVKQVPSFIQTLLQSTKYDDIQQSIYAAQLFTFEMELTKDKNGAPIVSYLQKFKNLLIVAAFDYCDDIYHGCTLFEGFKTYLQNLISVILEARQLEIQILRKNRKINLEEEENLKFCSILWTRDKIFDVIKLLKKESISIQVNCLYALHSLVVVITDHISQMDADKLSSANDIHIEHIKHLSWIEILSNSYLSLLSLSTTNNSRIFHFFKDFTCSNSNIKSAAILSLSSIANLIINFSSIFDQLCDYLIQFLQTINDNDHCDILKLFGCLSIAYFINGFVIDGIAQSKYSTPTIIIKKLYYIIEDYILNQNNQECGLIFAYSIIVSCACLHGCDLWELSYISIANKIVKIINQANNKTQQKYFVELLFCLSNIVGSSYLMNQISLELSSEFLMLISTLSDEIESTHVIGNLLFYLTAANHPKAKDIFPKLFNKYIMTSDQSAIKNANFLASSNGMIRIIFGISVEIFDAFLEKQKFDELIKYFESQINVNPNELIFVMLLATTYHLQNNSHTKRNRMPSNYKNLPASSIIRYLMDYIISFINEGKNDKVYILECILQCLTSESGYALPPFNWSTITSPILRMQLGSKVDILIFKLLLNQSKFLNFTSEYLISFLVSPLFISFESKTKQFIFKNMYIISNLNPVNKVKLFFIQTFQNKNNFYEFSQPLLLGLEEILSKKIANKEIIQLIYSYLNQIFNLYSCDDAMILKCLSHCPDDIIDNIINNVSEAFTKFDVQTKIYNDKNDELESKKGFVEMNEEPQVSCDDIESNHLSTNEIIFYKNIERRFKAVCFLISVKSQPLNLLCQSIELAALHVQNVSKSLLYANCLLSFNKFVNSSNLPHFLDDVHRMRWILDFISFISNFSKTKNCSDKSFEFLFMIFASAIISFSNHGLILLTCIFEKNHQNEYLKYSTSIILNLLPNCLHKLLHSKPWNQIEDNIIDWMIIMYNSLIKNQTKIKLTLEDCLKACMNEKTWEKITSILIMKTIENTN